jgi:hypothetical protein
MFHSVQLAIFAVFLTATLGLISFTQPIMNQPADPTPPAHKYTFLSLGDSYTIGESVEVKDRWSVQLAGLLRKKGVDVAPPDIIARTGWTTAALAEAIQKSGNAKTYDLVSLLIGVNNQYRGQPLDRYRTELRELLQTAIRFAKGKPGRVMVLSIPDWGVTPFATGRDRGRIAAESDAFNAICLEGSPARRRPVLNITPVTLQCRRHDPSQSAVLRLALLGRPHQLWADQVLAEVPQMPNNTYSPALLFRKCGKPPCLGLAVGDALGVPVELKAGPLTQPAPSPALAWLRHTQPAARHVVRRQFAGLLPGRQPLRGYDLDDAARHFIRWYQSGHWTPHGKCSTSAIPPAKPSPLMPRRMGRPLAGGFGRKTRQRLPHAHSAAAVSRARQAGGGTLPDHREVSSMTHGTCGRY